MRNFCAALLILTAAFAGPAAAQDMSWVGKVVFVKKPGIKIGKSDAQGNQIYFATLADFGYRALGEQAGVAQGEDETEQAEVDQEEQGGEGVELGGLVQLAEAAFDAVGKWRFSPTTLNNIPVEVECTFDVKFILGK